MSHLNHNVAELIDHVNHHHVYQDPIKRVNWLRLGVDDFWMPEQALSIYGLPEFVVLPEKDRRTLSQYEFIYFLQAALWTKSLILERLAKFSMDAHSHNDVALLKFYLSELREESGNSLLFTEIIQRSGLQKVPAQFGNLTWFNRSLRHAPVESSLFWLATLVVLDIPNRIYRVIRHHKGSSICPAIMDVAMYHSIEESERISFVHRIVNTWVKDLSPLKNYVARFFMRKMLKQFCDCYFYPHPSVYENAGLVPGRHWTMLARKNPHRIQFMRRQLSGITRNLNQLGMNFTKL